MKEDETIEQKKTYEDELLDIDYFDFSKVISEKLENLTFEEVKESKSFRELKKKMKIKAETEELEFQEVVNKIKALGIESEIYKNATQLARTKIDINTRIMETARHKNTNEKEFLVLLEKYLLEEHLEKDNEKGMKFLIANFEATEEQSNIIEKFDNLSGGIVELCGILETFGLISSEYRKEANSIFEEEKKLNEESLEIKREVDKFNSDIIEIREKINSFFIQKNTIVEMLNKSEGIAEIRKQLSSKVIFNDDYYFLFETLSFHFHFILQKDSLQILIEQDEGGKSEEEKIKAFNPKPVEKMIFFNDKISNSFSSLVNNEVTEITKTGTKKKNNRLSEEVVNVFISNGTIDTSETSRPLEEFDKLILQCIYSIAKKNKYFDIQMIKDFWGENRHRTKFDEDIEKSLTKLRTTLISIEIPEVIMKTYEKDFGKVGIKDNILPVREIYQIKGGHKKSVFAFTSKPLYFEYIEARGQMISTEDKKLLQGGVGKASKESVTLSGYIYRRIENAKYWKQKSRENKNIKYNKEQLEHIRFDTLFEMILTEEDKKLPSKSLQQKKSRTKINIILPIFEHHKRNKNIKNYREYDEGIKFDI